MLKASRVKKCKVCREEYSPANSLQKACSPKCALELVQRDKAKAEKEALARSRRELKAKMDKLKPRGQHLKEAQQAFNAFIRERDYGKPCISCGATPNDNDLITGSRMDAGHYRSVGSCPELRFEPLNCHAQCVKCNQHLSGNTVEYRMRLVERIGPKALNWLEGPHEPKKYTIDDLKTIKREYRQRARDIAKDRANNQDGQPVPATALQKG